MRKRVRLLNYDRFESLARRAKSNSSKSQGFNLGGRADKVQRQITVMQPGAYVQPHKHRYSTRYDRFELIVVLEGSVGIVFFNEHAKVIKLAKLSHDSSEKGIEIPPDTFHTIVCLKKNTVILQVKEGPSTARAQADYLPDFPLEEEEGSDILVKRWEKYFRLRSLFGLFQGS